MLKVERDSPSEPAKRPGAVRGRRTIDALFRSGRRITGSQVTLFFRDSADGGTRFSVFVPRRAGKPVARNRAKRVLREFVRNRPRQALSGRETIILFKQPVDRESLEKAKREISGLLDRMAGERKPC